MSLNKDLFNVSFKHIVLQPTSLCNLNCSYCYLPDRKSNLIMDIEIINSLVNSISFLPHPITLVWHGGEPLTIGLKKFRELVSPFDELRFQQKIRHNIQTNATAINNEWCKFLKDYDFSIGVSLDGTLDLNANRVDWANKSTFEKTLRGIKFLQDNKISFSVITVVNSKNIDYPRELLEFFISIGCENLCINIEEQEGLNCNSKGFDKIRVENFWKELFGLWRSNPAIRIREFDLALGWLDTFTKHKKTSNLTRDIWPTISYNGDVVLLSPEFVSVPKNELGKFVVGNITKQNLSEIIANSFDKDYVRDFFNGVEKCKRNCDYYLFCGGGQASNKYFENKNIDSMQTKHCLNTRQLLIDSVLSFF